MIGLAILSAAAAAPVLAADIHVASSQQACAAYTSCYLTIQTAVDAAVGGDIVWIHPGAYPGRVLITGKNSGGDASESQRLTIQAEAPDTAVVSGPRTSETDGCGTAGLDAEESEGGEGGEPGPTGGLIIIENSSFVTLRGLVVTGSLEAGILLRGGALQNTGIHLERNRIASNGTHCAEASLGGIVVQAGNPGTVIINNLIHDNLGDGVGIGEGRLNARGEPQRDGAPGTQTLLVQNTIHRNGWNGVSIIAPELPMLVNNAITSNGVDDAAAGGRAGVLLRGWYAPDGERVSLYNNLLCDNRLGEAGAHVFSGDHADNRTPTGAEGAGLVATPECASPGGVYESLAGADAIPGTLDDDFTLLQPGTGHLPSPAIDRGADPFALGLDLHFDASLYRADFEVPDTRPKQRDIGRPLDYDIGALELPCDCPNLCFGRCRMVIEGGSSSRDTCERSTFWDPDEECCDSSTGNTTPTNPPAMDNCPSNRYPIPGFEETRTDGCSRGNPLNPNNPTDPSELCGAHFRFGSSDIADPLPCNGHDVCYATCNTTQGQCDSAFLHDMFAVCEQPVSGPCALLVEDCLGWAESYAAAVAGFGEEGWIMGQNRSCQCCESR